jgi:RNA polymerase sigma factor (sigma-70 family)
MESTDDSALLRQYLEDHSDPAFAALVRRHINLVYSVALRHVGDTHKAEEITQAVFILLARNAAQLRHDKALSSWLFRATRLTASNFVRGETRRHRREQEAHMQAVLDESGSDVWRQIAPLLDTAVASLSEKDRQAIVLRFYEELQLLTENDWLSAAKEAKFDADADIRKALSNLRKLAKDRLPIDSALLSFTSANNGQLPTDLSQLKPYFKSALDEATLDAVFARYKLLHTGTLSDLPPDGWIVVEKAPVDKDYDSLAVFGNGWNTSTQP